MTRPLRFALRLIAAAQVHAWLATLAARGLTPQIGALAWDWPEVWAGWSEGEG